MFAAAGAHAATLTVDGNLNDWGVTVADNNGSVFTTINPGIGFMGSFIDDRDDNAGDGGFLDPHYGGQNYDTEFMGAALQGNTLYIAIVSGLRPDNGFTRYGPGDMIITSSQGTFGIEMGGGAGGGSDDPIVTGDAGSHYTLNSNGFTTGHATTASNQVVGGIYSGDDITWVNNTIAPLTPTQFLVNDGSVEALAFADFVWNVSTDDTGTAQHSIIEMSFDVRTFLDASGSGTLDIIWGPACGNDFVHLTLFIPTADEVPAPAAGGLMLFGLLGFAALRRRRAR